MLVVAGGVTLEEHLVVLHRHQADDVVALHEAIDVQGFAIDLEAELLDGGGGRQQGQSGVAGGDDPRGIDGRDVAEAGHLLLGVPEEKRLGWAEVSRILGWVNMGRAAERDTGQGHGAEGEATA